MGFLGTSLSTQASPKGSVWVDETCAKKNPIGTRNDAICIHVYVYNHYTVLLNVHVYLCTCTWSMTKIFIVIRQSMINCTFYCLHNISIPGAKTSKRNFLKTEPIYPGAILLALTITLGEQISPTRRTEHVSAPCFHRRKQTSQLQLCGV